MKPLVFLLAVLIPSLSCFNDCDRTGCESFGKRASASIAQGIAGSVSLESDQVSDGCQICSYSEAGLEIWKATVAVHESAAGCPLAVMPAPTSFTALGRYDHALEPGEYMVCVSSKTMRPCIGVSVTAGQVTTLNVKHQFGPSMVAVLDPGSAAFRSDTFNCPGAGH